MGAEQVLACNLSAEKEPPCPQPQDRGSRDAAAVEGMSMEKGFLRVAHFFNLPFLTAERTKKNVICLGQWKRKTGVYFCFTSKMQTSKRKL